MSFQSNTLHIQQYKSNVMLLLQQNVSRLQNAVLIQSFQGKAASVVEQFGQTAAVRLTGRHSDTPHVSTPQDRRWVLPLDYA